MPNDQEATASPRHFACSWHEIFNETQWGTSVPTKIFLWNNPGVYVDYCYPDPTVPHFKGAWKFLGSPIQTVLPGPLGEQVSAALHDAVQNQQPILGTYSFEVNAQVTTVIIRFLPLNRHILGLVHDFPSAARMSQEAEPPSHVSPDLIQPLTSRKGPFSQSGFPRIHVSIPLHSIDDSKNTPLGQNLEETFIKNLADSFELDVIEAGRGDARSFSCSGPLPLISKFLVTLKALFPPESTDA
ncbi:MAG TPA: hypothetical protein DD706_19435 [Nitrospiraceae bacterium]|nr:hypothetical protein [Nitrospiraceae bacterium]